MLKKVKDYVNKWHMLQKEDRVIVGVSGGADSICLLFVLLELKKELGFDMVVVHVNHGLRGAEADEDEAYVKRICKEQGLTCACYFENVELIAKKRKQSTEEAGREVRRSFFEEAMRAYNGNKIALAHHENDNAETFLFHLARGTGLKGLGGIAPVKDSVIRPLLCVSRKEIEAYLLQKRISYQKDKTNEEDDYTRNRIRHHIIPYMQAYMNEKAVEHMNDTMEQIRHVQEFLSEQVCEACKRSVSKTEEGTWICKEEYQVLPEAIKPLLIKQVLSDVAGKEKDLEAVHVKQVQELFGRQTGRKVDLPYQMEAKRVYSGILIRVREEKKSVSPGEVVWRKDETGEKFFWGEREIRCRVYQKGLSEKNAEKEYAKQFDYDIIQNNVSFRTRRPGDYITIHPDGRTQKLKSYFINEKIPENERDGILLIADGSHILWIAGYRTNPKYQVCENTKHILEIQIDKGESKWKK